MKFTKMLMHYITKYFLGFLIVFLSSILVAFVASRSIEDYIIEKGEMKNQEGINGIYEMVNKMELINEIRPSAPLSTSRGRFQRRMC